MYFVPEGCFILANSADTDEMSHYMAFHLGLHWLSKYLFTGIHYEKTTEYKLLKVLWQVTIHGTRTFLLLSP